MPKEAGTPAWGIDPGVPHAPDQQQRAGKLAEKLVQGLATGKIENGAKHAKSARIAGGPQDRLHQSLIHIGAIEIDPLQGAPDRGRPPQVLKQQALQRRTAKQGPADAAAGNGPPAGGRPLLVGKRTGGIDQGHPGGLRPQSGAGRQSRIATEGIANQDRRPANFSADVGLQLVTPQGPAVGEPCGLGATAETQQVDGMHLMVLREHGNVVTPVVRGSPKPMHQQQGGTLGLRR